jgi:hypothetical protein
VLVIVNGLLLRVRTLLKRNMEMAEMLNRLISLLPRP